MNGSYKTHILCKIYVKREKNIKCLLVMIVFIWDNKVLQAYEIRKIHHEGENRVSRGIVIPLKFLKELDLDHGDYVKIYLGEKEKQGGKRLCLEKLQQE